MNYPDNIDRHKIPGYITAMEASVTLVAFAGARLLTEGPLEDVLAVLKRRFDTDRGDAVLVFDVDSGRQLDFDLRGSPAEVLAREAPSPLRGPGRPKLGVVSREVTLLPQHWHWLEQLCATSAGH